MEEDNSRIISIFQRSKDIFLAKEMRCEMKCVQNIQFNKNEGKKSNPCARWETSKIYIASVKLD